MERAGSALVGRHDFSAFGVAHRQPVRTVYAVRVRRDGSCVTIDVTADAFLRQMVRRIVAALLEVGHGKTDGEAVAAALASGRPAFNGALAPASSWDDDRQARSPDRTENDDRKDIYGP
jgi:tRNA pseudouridine38-40 synthase